MLNKSVYLKKVIVSRLYQVKHDSQIFSFVNVWKKKDMEEWKKKNFLNLFLNEYSLKKAKKIKRVVSKLF